MRLTKDIMSRDTDEELMKYAREEESHNLSDKRWHASPNHWRIDMPFHELEDWLVPRRPISSDSTTVPPISIEFSVSKTHDFCKGIQERLEESIESS
jgi:hypothetical protein